MALLQVPEDDAGLARAGEVPQIAPIVDARLAPCLAGRPVVWDWDDFAEAQAHYASIGLAPPVNAP